MSHFQPWPYARVLAHRGGGALAPENTLAGIRYGYDLGFRAVEFDARLARDELPVVIHDRTLERTTNGHGEVAALTAAQLAQLDAGGWFAPRYAGEPVPTLDAAIAFCRAQGIWIDLEIKRAPGVEAHIGEVVACTAAQGYADLLRSGGDRAENVDPRVPLLTSFSRAALLAAREAAPDLPRGFLVHGVPEDWMAELEAMGCVSLHVDHELLKREQALAIKKAGYWLFCYTVDDPGRAREILGWGVDALCTDRIDLIGAAFA
jgi:glycerophosphoryl diester phosphodiesterase